MGFIDWLIVIILALGAFNGFRKGLVATLVRIGAASVVFLLIGQIFPLVKNGLIVNLKLGLVPATILAAILIFVALAVIIRLIQRLLINVLKGTHLSGLNKFLGLVFGFVNGLVVIIIMMVLLDCAPRISQPLKDGAKHRVYAAVDTLKEDIFATLKFDERDRFQQIKDKLKQEKEKSQSSQ